MPIILEEMEKCREINISSFNWSILLRFLLFLWCLQAILAFLVDIYGFIIKSRLCLKIMFQKNKDNNNPNSSCLVALWILRIITFWKYFQFIPILSSSFIHSFPSRWAKSCRLTVNVRLCTIAAWPQGLFHIIPHQISNNMHPSPPHFTLYDLS